MRDVERYVDVILREILLTKPILMEITFAQLTTTGESDNDDDLSRMFTLN